MRDRPDSPIGEVPSEVDADQPADRDRLDGGGEGTTLAERLGGKPLTVEEQIDLALSLAEHLATIHRAGVTHGDINAHNVVLLPGGSTEAELTGFGRATTVAERHPAFVHHDVIDGTLATLAPEQTGRTARSVDQRADLYGLGATLYHVTTGTLPFEADDALQLVHDVLARIPTPPAERSSDVPVALSDIIMRLLEKEPDQRYQSAEGLVQDLRRLRSRHRLGEQGRFPLGEHDFPHRLSAPSRLIGRDTEIDTLRLALEWSCRGTCQIVLVRGAPGAGKTALINELRPMVTALGGWFVAGKSDQYRRDLATDTVCQALRALGRLLLTEPEADLFRHRARLLGALGANAELIASVQPEIALVLGAGKHTATVDGTTTRTRMIRAAVDVLRTTASPQRPIVVVLDDLQWASETAIGAIDAIVREAACPGLLLVCAYRPGEVALTHPLAVAMARWGQADLQPVALDAQNLAPADLSTMIAEMLRIAEPTARSLAEVIGEKTGGNPFDTVTLLNALREDRALIRDGSGWHWDQATIRHHVGEGDVVDLLARRIDRLPPRTAVLLGSLACLGGEVSHELLAASSGLPREALDADLAPALADGLLIPGQGGESGTDDVLRFRHDRVQQAATARLTPIQRRALHLTLARRLATRAGRFSGIAAEQYLPATAEVNDPQERRQVIELFRQAADALRLVNPTMTERFLAAALTVAGLDDPHLRIGLETSHHAALCHLGRLVEADERYRSIEAMHPPTLELARAACERITSLTLRDRPEEAVAVGLEMLRRLGVDVPEQERLGERIAEDLERFQKWGAQPDGLAADLARAEASDPRGAAAANLISRMIPPAFFVGMEITPWLVFQCQQLWAEHGPSRSLVGPLCHAAFMTILVGGDYRTGYEVARRVLTVCEDHGHEPEASHARLIFGLSAAHWFEPLESGITHAQRGLPGLIQGGDQQNAGFAAYALIPSPLECTPTIHQYLAEVDRRLAYAAATHNDQTHGALVVYRQLARGLLGWTDRSGSLSDDAFDVDCHLQRHQGNAVASCYAHIVHAINATIFGDAEGMDRHSAAAMTLLPVFEATLSTALVRVVRALALARRLHQRERAWLRADSVPMMEELSRIRDWLAARAGDAPGNFEHLLSLVDGERSWALGDPLAAARAFDAALLAVRGRQRPWHAAVIAERAAHFHFAQGMEHTGRMLLVEARDRYEAWGAVAKVRALEAVHGFLRSTGSSDPITRRTAETGEAIDLQAMFEACQALSSETSLGRLHARVRDVLGAATGATDVLVVIRCDEPRGWFIPPDPGAGGLGTPLDTPEGGRMVPMLPFRYAERTRKPLLVADVACDDRFASDPCLRQRRCRSLLVVPVHSSGVLRAMLVLEHRLSSGAFTADRLDAVRLLTGQLAVSLENAMVYEELEDRVRQRTEQLRAAQSELVSTARHVGLAEMASNVLHNVGNVLTSVNVSAGLVAGRVRTSKIDGLTRAIELLHQHRGDLGEFLTVHERGRVLSEYLVQAAQALREEHRDVAEELDRLMRNIEHIMDIVATQQANGGGGLPASEPVSVSEVIDDAVRINTEALVRHEITVIRRCSGLPMVRVDRTRLLLILVNLISNAKAALLGTLDRPRTVTITATVMDGAGLRITVEDNGEGIPSDSLTRIFAHGFTTRPDGHGFGLHSSALAAGEMGGTLQAESAGPGCGATFVLRLPATIEGAGC